MARYLIFRPPDGQPRLLAECPFPDESVLARADAQLPAPNVGLPIAADGWVAAAFAMTIAVPEGAEELAPVSFLARAELARAELARGRGQHRYRVVLYGEQVTPSPDLPAEAPYWTVGNHCLGMLRHALAAVVGCPVWADVTWDERGRATIKLDVTHAANMRDVKAAWQAKESILALTKGGRPPGTGTFRDASEFVALMRKIYHALKQRGRAFTQKNAAHYLNENPDILGRLQGDPERMLRWWCSTLKVGTWEDLRARLEAECG